MYPFISFIEFCNTKTNKYYNTLDFPPDGMNEIRNNSFELIDKSVQDEENYIVRSFSSKDKKQNVLSFVVKDYINEVTVIIINIDLNYISQILGPPAQNNNYIYLIDKQGNVIAGTNNKLTQAEVIELIDVNSIYSGRKQGYTTKTSNGSYVVNYLPCSIYNWFLVSAMQYNLATAQRWLYFKICIFSALGFIVLGCISVTVMSQIIYSPFKKILNNFKANTNQKQPKGVYDETELILGQINSLQQKVAFANNKVYRTQDAAGSHILTNLILGKKITQTVGMLNFFDKLQYLLNAKIYRVILFDIDNYKELSSVCSVDDMDLYCFGISNIITELLEYQDHVETISISPSSICAIISGSNVNNIDESVLSHISLECNNFIDSTLTIVVGDCVDNIENICSSYQSCILYSGLKFILGSNLIIDKEVYSKYSSLNDTFTYD